MRKARGRVGILEGSGVVVARPRHRRRDLRKEQRGHNDGVAAFLDLREDRQAFRVALFMRIERVHEDARVNRVPKMAGLSSSL